MKRRIFISIIILIILAPLCLLGYLLFKNYYFPNGFSAVYDLKEESRFITPLKPLGAVGPIYDEWTPGTAQTQLGTFNIERREIYQAVIDEFVYTDIFLPTTLSVVLVPLSVTKKFEKLDLTLLYRADTPELKVCLKISPPPTSPSERGRDGVSPFGRSPEGRGVNSASGDRVSDDNGDWSCQKFYVDRQAENWFNLTAMWDLANAYQIKPRHYRIGFFLPGISEKNGLFQIRKIEIGAK